MNQSKVFAFQDDDADKYSLLERLLDAAGLFELIEAERARSGKSRADFRIAIKPNLAMMLRRADVGTYTDPFLVIHLLRLLLARDYTNLAVVESQNLYGLWFQNRSVTQIAARAGYFENFDLGEPRPSREIHVRGHGVDARVPLVDLTLDTVEHNFGPPVGKILVGKTWAEADFRLNFPKMKSHFYSYYTLAIKNIYGCLPLADKVRGYHCKKAVGLYTAHLLKHFPVHFTVVDAYSAADGWLGVKMKAIAKKPHLLLASSDIMALDHFGARIMNIPAEKNTLFAEAAKFLPLTPYTVVGDHRPLSPWRNPPYLMVWGSRLIEAQADIMDFMGALATGGYDPCFPHRSENRAPLKRAIYQLTRPVNLLLDAGAAQLRFREHRFFRQLAAESAKFPGLAAAADLKTALTFLSPADLEQLAAIVEQIEGSELSFSGHYLFGGGREFAFPARLPAVPAAILVLEHLRASGADRGRWARELKALAAAARAWSRTGDAYAYCYV